MFDLRLKTSSSRLKVTNVGSAPVDIGRLEGITGVAFGASTNKFSFDNAAGLATVTTLSAVGVNGAFVAPDGV
jgi:hypothetical protein